MGNNPSKDTRSPQHPGPAGQQHPQSHGHAASTPNNASPGDGKVYPGRSAGARSSRPDLSFLHIGRERAPDTTSSQRPRETKQEREARRAERDRQARVKERERSMREEGVDGGYLVTLGTYTGPEDFSKPVVRQLMIERRLAPFWRGLNDHNDAWTEAQLVAAARGLPIPAPDEIPPDMARTASQMSSEVGQPAGPSPSEHIPVASTSRSPSFQPDTSANLSTSHPAFSTATTGSQLLRGRAKTFVSLTSGRNTSSSDLVPQEIRLPRDPYINGQPLEAHLYQNAVECPICFLYYPPYLNRTRCCDQPICSECFVQIKRPDPHPPEHEQPGQTRPPEEDAEMLVSEVAACPFCVTPEFGVTYDPPHFRRGLGYANALHSSANVYRNPLAAMSSTSSLPSASRVETRRRATSLSATAPNVITTDRVRPDWASKLADARAHALRRSAAATALHNAAYVLGNGGSDGPGRATAAATATFALGRRRRGAVAERSPSASGTVTPGDASGNTSADLVSGRTSSRRNRVEHLEDLMMMEAIRLSLAAEEERKRKEEKDAQRAAKKTAKDARKADKKTRRSGSPPPAAAASSSSLLQSPSSSSAANPNPNDGNGNATTADASPSSSRTPSASASIGPSWTASPMSRSESQIAAGAPPIREEESVPGKGKQPLTTTLEHENFPVSSHAAPGSSSALAFHSSHDPEGTTLPNPALPNDTPSHDDDDDDDEPIDLPSSSDDDPLAKFRSLAPLIATSSISDSPPPPAPIVAKEEAAQHVEDSAAMHSADCEGDGER